MPSTVTEKTVQFLEVTQSIDIAAPIEVAFEALVAQLGPEGEMPGPTKMNMAFEPWPGGRWYRDLGGNNGHLWGHVQVIKPPTLLEISGPLFMSYPACNHIQYRLTAEGKGTRLNFIHKALGQISPEHSKGVGEGWGLILKHIGELAQKRMASK